MEWKIGEIKQVNGEWYQCVEQPEKYDKTVCALCAFQGNGDCELDRCSGTYRSDKKFVIFKKLEKVGEPYEFDGHLFQSYRTFEVPIFTENYATVRELGNNSKISIEIKQNKKDMEKYQAEDTPLTRLVGKYVNNLIDYETFEEAVKGLYSDKEESKLILKEFDFEAAKAGKSVCTRDGRKVRIICFDAEKKDGRCIIALVPSKDYPGFEDLITYPNNGNYYGGHENNGDLMMLPEKKKGWAVIRRRDIYETEEQAKEVLLNSRTAMMIKKISWEE